jgi:hypothetical protein
MGPAQGSDRWSFDPKVMSVPIWGSTASQLRRAGSPRHRAQESSSHSEFEGQTAETRDSRANKTNFFRAKFCLPLHSLLQVQMLRLPNSFFCQLLFLTSTSPLPSSIIHHHQLINIRAQFLFFVYATHIVSPIRKPLYHNLVYCARIASSSALPLPGRSCHSRRRSFRLQLKTIKQGESEQE